MYSVGLVGIGLLGSALAERMQAAGMQVFGYDVAAERREAFAAAAGVRADSAADVFRRATTVVLSLPDSDVVRAVMKAVDTELRPGLLVIDTTTGDPEATRSLGERLDKRGVAYLDATIVGSSVAVREGQAMVMVGGGDAAFAAARGILDCFGRHVIHLGAWGSGARMKLVVNLVLGLNRAVLAEGLTLAAALELDGAQTLATLQASAAYSAVMDTKGQKMLAGDFAPQARLAQHLKDVRLMLAAAQRTGTGLPLSQVHRELLERAVSLGLGELDNSAIVRAFHP